MEEQASDLEAKMPVWVRLTGLGGGAVLIGIALASEVVERFPHHAEQIRVGAWIVGGAAIGTAIAPGLGTVIGAGSGALVAWLTS